MHGRLVQPLAAAELGDLEARARADPVARHGARLEVEAPRQRPEDAGLGRWRPGRRRVAFTLPTVVAPAAVFSTPSRRISPARPSSVHCAFSLRRKRPFSSKAQASNATRLAGLRDRLGRHDEQLRRRCAGRGRGVGAGSRGLAFATNGAPLRPMQYSPSSATR